MIKRIKSSYFIKILFLYIDKKHKLEIVKYNKSLQKNIDISIINSKHLARSYVICEPNGFGKEYNGKDDSLLFVSEYLKGQRNEEGKQYYCNQIIFEGEYLKGKKMEKEKNMMISVN